MDYYLFNIKTLLEAQGYTNIYINYLLENTSTTSLTDAIFLFAEGGNNDGSQIEYTQDFAIYVRRGKASEARTDAEAIWKYLNYYTGGTTTATSVPIKRITTRQSPMPYNFDSGAKIHEFVITMTAHVVDTDFLTIK